MLLFSAAERWAGGVVRLSASVRRRSAARDGQVGHESRAVVDAALLVARRLEMSSVLTLNICPAPSQSLAVMIGVCT